MGAPSHLGICSFARWPAVVSSSKGPSEGQALPGCASVSNGRGWPLGDRPKKIYDGQLTTTLWRVSQRTGPWFQYVSIAMLVITRSWAVFVTKSRHRNYENHRNDDATWICWKIPCNGYIVQWLHSAMVTEPFLCSTSRPWFTQVQILWTTCIAFFNSFVRAIWAFSMFRGVCIDRCADGCICSVKL